MRPAAVFAFALGLIEILEAYFRRHAGDGLHFQHWTSEVLMQSVSLRELRAAPFESLWYLHIQPPVCNLLRAVLAVSHRDLASADPIRAVDRDLYHVWAMAGAALAALVDAWFRKLRVPGWLAALFALGWLLHPANLGYTTLLDGTLLSALVTTWILFETWRLGHAPGGSLRPLIAAVLIAYLTRSVFQWQFMVVMLAALVLVRVPLRGLVTFASAVGLVVGLYSVKQAWLFGTVSTSTFEGTNLTRAINADCTGVPAPPAAPRPSSKAAVLTERTKLDGSENFNHVDRLEIERGLVACFRHNLATRRPASLLAAYAESVDLYLRPSSNYWSNTIVDQLPWRELADQTFSGRRLLWLALAAGALGLWQARRRPRAALAVALPFAYVLLVSVIGERGENMRFKFFLEPSLYVLLATQLHRVARQVLIVAEVVSAVLPTAERSAIRDVPHR